ncbi:MAG: efflux RND transporter periplasmic adaptor subunit [Bradymonadaceae bacterium]|nr:efflux RND transporter periplasmic adaptor subunit [Lujinxingiaceae bacterium]
MNTRLLFVAFASLLTLGGPGCTGDKGELEAAGAAVAPAPAPRAVRVSAVARGALVDSLGYVGTVHAEREVQIMSRVPATVVEVRVEQGDAVSSGDLLVRMEAPDLEARIERLEAEAARVRTERDFQCATFETDRELAREGVLTQALADASQSRCLAAEQGHRAAQAARAEAMEGRRRLREASPVDGVVLRRLVEAGEYAAPGRPLIVIGSGELELRVAVTESDLRAGLKPGKPAIIRTGDREARATVNRIAPVARGPGRTVEVRLGLPPELVEGLKPGMSADVAFIMAESLDALTVMEEAVLDDGEQSFVFVVEGERLRRVAVVTGVRAGGRVEVSAEGLTSRTRVVLGGLEGLKDGELVYPVDLQQGARR